MPLRLFLGVTFCYAGLQKLADPRFFDPAAPTSIQQQMRLVQASSPIGFLVSAGAHAGWVVGLVIALGELAVGLGTLAGLRSRTAAVGGMVLSLSFFLTVSWSTTPYFYGADIVFLFAWTPFAALGSGGVCSPGRLVATRTGPEPARTPPDGSPSLRPEGLTDRRALIGLGATGAVLAGIAALVGRLAESPGASAGTRTAGGPAGGGRKHQHAHHAHHSGHPTTDAPTASRGAPPGMTRVASLHAIPIGDARRFQDPATGSPAWLVRTGPRECAAFSAICTHQGCTVNFEASAREFVCPCHGGLYSARTGQVLAGPPPAPLRRVRVRISGHHVYAV